MWILYDLIYILGFLVYLPGAFRRKRLPHAGWAMRLGRYPQPVLDALREKPTVWLHAVSVGEVLSAKTLIQKLEQHSGTSLVVSTITPSGQEVLQKRVVQKAPTIYFPLDLGGCVAASLKHINPKVLLLMESELWPRMIQKAQARGIPVVVVNGRVSPRSFKRYRSNRWWVNRVLRSVSCFLMQSELDAQRLVDVGVDADRVQVTGNIKWDASVSEPPQTADVHSLRMQMQLKADDFVWVAGSTHRGEEELLLDVLRKTPEGSRVRLIIAVRHLERLDEVEALVRSRKLRAARASACDETWDVLLVDSFGRLMQYYALADVVTIGGSFIPHGGQNPLEAAALGKPIIFGPHMFNFPEITDTLLKENAAMCAQTSEDLRMHLADCIESEPVRKGFGRRAADCVQKHTGATENIFRALQPYLESSP